MRCILSRLRAALTPQAVMLLAAMLMLAMGLLGTQEQQSSPLEKRISKTLSAVEGAGSVCVTIREREVAVTEGTLSAARIQSVPCGAVAVAQGADDPLVAMELQAALCALLGLSPSAVSIMTGGK